MMRIRNQTYSTNRFYIWRGGVEDPTERAGVVSILLVFYRNSFLFCDEDGFSDRLGVKVGLWDARTGRLSGGGEADVVV
jgi:hypothetical protein